MKKNLIRLSLAGTCCGLIACSTVGPVAATSNPVSVTSKVGTDCSRDIFFGVIPVSGKNNTVYDASIQGNITKISTVDQEWFTFLGLYNSTCTVVHGE